MFSQIVAVTAVNLRSINQRLGSSAVAIFGIVGVVIVFVAVLSIAEGFRTAMRAAGDPDTVMVLRAGADTEMTSGLLGEHVRVSEDAPGIARDDGAGPLVSPELLVIVDHPLRRSGVDANLPLRGVEPGAFRIHDKMRIVAGRRFEPGRNELIVGTAAARQFVGLDIGSTVKWGQSTWQVVGIFENNHSVSEGEVWCDARVLQPAYRRGNSYQAVYVKLASHDAFDTLKDSLTTDPRLNVTALRETAYYERESQA